MNSKKKINWVLTQATHYHNYLISKIQEQGNIEVRIFYYSKLLKEYPWKTELLDFDNQYTVKKSAFGIDYRLLFEWIRAPKSDFFILAGWHEKTSVIFLTYCALFKLNYIIQTDTPQVKKPATLFYFLREKWLKFILSRSKFILVTGATGIQEIERICTSRTPVFNFPFIVNLDFFKIENKVFQKPNFRIFSSGRLVNDHKGYLIMLKGIALLRDKKPDLNFKYTIAGEGPDREAISNLIKELHLTNYVELIGWVEIEDLPNLYNDCDIFLHDSYFDPYPNAVLEAMACGRIVVASTAAGSAKDRIIHSENGFLVEPGDFVALGDELCHIIGLKYEVKEEISKKARITAEKWDYKYNLSIIDKILSNS